MSFLSKTKVVATDPWDDETTDADTKKYFAPAYRKTDFKRDRKIVDFRDKTMSLVISVESYLSDLDDCPTDKEMALAYKDGIKKMLEEAKELRKIKEEWDALNRLHTSQLLGDK